MHEKNCISKMKLILSDGQLLNERSNGILLLRYCILVLGRFNSVNKLVKFGHFLYFFSITTIIFRQQKDG